MLQKRKEKLPTIKDNRSNLFNQIFLYTILFIILALGVYLSFLVCGRSMLRNGPGNIDGLAQQFPIYANIRFLLGSLLRGDGFSFWSWDLGLGSDYFIAFKDRLFNPLTYIASAFPIKYLDLGYSIMVVLRQYFSGIAFLFFARSVKLNEGQQLIGSICYVFSGWIVVSTVSQGTFTNATILFPLLVMGVERLLERKSPTLFIVSVFLFLALSITWAYVAALIIVIYYMIRYFYYYSGSGIKTFFQKFGCFIGYGVIGVLLSGIFIIQNFFKISNATTDSTVEYNALYTLKEYLTLPAGFFSYKETLTPYSFFFIPIICVIVLPLLVINVKKKSSAAIMALLCFTMALFPVFGSIFNGFSYSVSRWFFVLAFFMVWAAVECLNIETMRSKRNLCIMTAWLIFLAFWVIVVCYFALDIVDSNAMWAAVIGLGFGLIIIGCYYIRRAYPDNSKKFKIINFVIVIMLIGSIIGAANMKFYPGVNPFLNSCMEIGKTPKKYGNSVQRVGRELQKEDQDFYRIDQVEGIGEKRSTKMRSNENIYFGNRSIYTYFSTMSSSWHEFNKTMGNNSGYFDRTTSYSNDNRAALDYLMGVKYFLGDSDKRTGASDYAPYGFDYDRTIDGVDILKNKYCMGLGTTYSQYITESELEQYSYLEREQVLMQAAVVPDNYTDTIKTVKHSSVNDLETELKRVKYSISNEENLQFEDNGKLTVRNGGGGFDLSIPKVKNCQIVISFDNLVRKTNDYDDNLRLSGIKPGTLSGLGALTQQINRTSFKDNEKFDLTVEKDNVVKAALNRKGKNQGFDDVVDYNINMGYFNEAEGKFHVEINRLGEYQYDRLSVYAVPMDIYNKNAKILDDNRYKIEDFQNDYVKGKINTPEDRIMYFSILNTPGWKIYVDGKEADKIDDVNISFTGAVVSAGEHLVELKYTSPGLKIGVIISAAGVIIFVGLLLVRRKKAKACHH